MPEFSINNGKQVLHEIERDYRYRGVKKAWYAFVRWFKFSRAWWVGMYLLVSAVCFLLVATGRVIAY